MHHNTYSINILKIYVVKFRFVRFPSKRCTKINPLYTFYRVFETRKAVDASGSYTEKVYLQNSTRYFGIHFELEGNVIAFYRLKLVVKVILLLSCKMTTFTTKLYIRTQISCKSSLEKKVQRKNI